MIPPTPTSPTTQGFVSLPRTVGGAEGHDCILEPSPVKARVGLN